MLYVLTFSNYFFSFITVPYQTRVLGPELYGVLGFAFAAMVYFQLLLDFGFILSGTAEIAKEKNDKTKVAKICESIIASKTIMFVASVLLLAILCTFVPQFSSYRIVFWICILYTFLNSIIPDFLYRGMEDMLPITVRTIIVKFLFTVGIFILVKDSDDYIWVPLLYLFGSLTAVIIAILDVRKRFHLKAVSISINDIFRQIKLSFPFFISRIASTVYGATNTLLLGLKFNGQDVVGFYTSADKVVTIARTGSSPIADSLYPYMITHKDFKLVKKILSIAMPIVILFSIIIFVFAPQICTFVFGNGYEPVSVPLRALIPVIIIVLPSYIFGFPMMTPLGIERFANLSVVLGAIIQILILIVLWTIDSFNLLSVCLASSFTETFVFVFRFIVVRNHLHNLEK